MRASLYARSLTSTEHALPVEGLGSGPGTIRTLQGNALCFYIRQRRTHGIFCEKSKQHRAKEPVSLLLPDARRKIRGAADGGRDVAPCNAPQWSVLPQAPEPLPAPVSFPTDLRSLFIIGSVGSMCSRLLRCCFIPRGLRVTKPFQNLGHQVLKYRCIQRIDLELPTSLDAYQTSQFESCQVM